MENNKDLNVATVQEENALVVRDETTLKSTPKAEAQGNGHKQATENGNHEPHQDVINRFNKQTAAVEQHSAKQADAVRLQFDEECLNRGYGIRPVAPIRIEELKAKIYKYGFWFAMILAFILGCVNANQVIDDGNIALEGAVKFSVIVVVVGFTLLGFEYISKSILTGVLDLRSFRNQGERTIKRSFTRLGLIWLLVGLFALLSRADTGLPEFVGIGLFMIWEWITVAIAALCSLASAYHAWSGELSEQYDEAVALSYGL